MQISVGSPELFMSTIGARMTNGAIESMRAKANDFYGAISNAGERIYQHARKRMDEFVGVEWHNKVTGMKRQIERFFKPDNIRPLLNIGDMQNSPASMQPYIMSHPTMYSLYESGTIAAYGDAANFDRENCGLNNHHYREMTSGVAMRVEGTDNYVIHNFYELKNRDEVALSQYEKAACVATCLEMEKLLDEQDYDPTDCWNGVV